MATACVINFDQNEYGTYFAGQMVSGKIILQTSKTKIVKGFMIKISGCARTRWHESTGTSSNRKSTTFYGNEDYFATATYLLGSDNSQTVEIPPGTHAYSFACSLPPHCPSSYEGNLGYIRYTIKAVLIRPWKFDQTFTRGFTVLRFTDLNYESPLIRMPAVQEISKNFYCAPCGSQPLNIHVTVPQTGFVPGQSIRVTIRVTNESNVLVTDIKISLVMMAVLFSEHPRRHTRIERKNLVKLMAGPINTLSTREITESIQVPAAPPTCLTFCRIIQVSYQIEVEAKVKGWHENPFITIPITIGTLPLYNVIQQQPAPLPNEFHYQGANDTGDSNRIYTVSNEVNLPVNGGLSSSSEFPPPSYQEAVFMARVDCNKEDQHPLGESDFVPRYPVYDISDLDNERLSNTDESKSTWL